MILQEKNLQFDFSRAISAKKFDGPDHGLSHCMKAVDFVVELEKSILFIEVKGSPGMDATLAAEFLKEFRSGDVVRDKLVPKCRDSYIYASSCQDIQKPIIYFILLGFEKVDAPLLLTQTEELKRVLPLDGPAQGQWKKPFIQYCAIVDLALWRERLNFPVSIV